MSQLRAWSFPGPKIPLILLPIIVLVLFVLYFKVGEFDFSDSEESITTPHAVATEIWCSSDLVGELKSLDDIQNLPTTLTAHVLHQTHEQFFRVSEKGVHSRLFLTNWENASFRQWTFHIRPDAKWGNNLPVTGEQIRANLLHQLSDKRYPLYRHLAYAVLKDGKIPEDTFTFDEVGKTFTFRLQKEVVDLPQILAGRSTVLRQPQYLGKPFSQAEEGSGPYRLARAEQNELVLESKQDGRALTDRFVFKVGPLPQQLTKDAPTLILLDEDWVPAIRKSIVHPDDIRYEKSNDMLVMEIKANQKPGSIDAYRKLLKHLLAPEKMAPLMQMYDGTGIRIAWPSDNTLLNKNQIDYVRLPPSETDYSDVKVADLYRQVEEAGYTGQKLVVHFQDTPDQNAFVRAMKMLLAQGKREHGWDIPMEFVKHADGSYYGAEGSQAYIGKWMARERGLDLVKDVYTGQWAQTGWMPAAFEKALSQASDASNDTMRKQYLYEAIWHEFQNGTVLSPVFVVRAYVSTRLDNMGTEGLFSVDGVLDLSHLKVRSR